MFTQIIDETQLLVGDVDKFFGVCLWAEFVGQSLATGVREDLVVMIIQRNCIKLWRVGQVVVQTIDHVVLGVGRRNLHPA